jgi:hypothetical protein
LSKSLVATLFLNNIVLGKPLVSLKILLLFGGIESATLGLQPHTWDGLKTSMCQIFVPPSYQHDLHKKLQCLDQGDMSVQDYYAEL